MTDFRESEIHNDIREGVRLVCGDFPDAYWRDLDERHEFPWEFYKALAEGGWWVLPYPRSTAEAVAESPKPRSCSKRWLRPVLQ